MSKLRVCVMLAIAGALLSVASAQPLRFTVAIVRLDGRLVPFAGYDSGRWEQAWPDAAQSTDGKPAIANVHSVWRARGEPVPSAWHVWPASGGKPIQVHVSGAEVVDAHCESQVALVTNLPPREGEHPLKLGLAVDSNIPVAAIETVPRGDALWTAAEQVVAASFDGLEAARARTDHRQVMEESPPAVPRLAVLYRQARSPRSPMYFIAKKEYRAPGTPPDPACGRVTIVTGWLIGDEIGTLTLKSPRVFLTDCDAKEATTALPLGAIHVADRLFWVLQEHGYEDEAYVIAEIGPAEVRHLIEIYGGGC